MRNPVRKKFLVNKNQSRLCLKILVLNCLPVLLLSLTALVVCFRFQKFQQMNQLGQTLEAVTQSLQNVAPHFILAFFLVNVAITWFTLLVYTNKVYGPIHRLQMQLKRVVAGEISRLPALKFRKNDEFSELAELLNLMNERSAAPVTQSVEKWKQPVLFRATFLKPVQDSVEMTLSQGESL